MIFNIPVGGAKKVAVTLNGAPGETITYSGETSGSITLNSSGTGVIPKLKVGSYTFNGSVSGHSTKSITINADRTVNVFPAGAIYWYGREVYTFSLARQGSTVGELTKHTNYMRLFYNGATTGSKERAAAALTDSSVNMANYTSLHFVTQTETQGANGYSGVFNTRTITYSAFQDSSIFTAKSSLLNTAGKTQYSVDISGVSAGYVGTGIAEYSAYDRKIQIQAIWMEGAGEDDAGDDGTEGDTDTPDDPGTGTLQSLSTSIAINSTYRHCNALYTSDFVRVGSLGSDLQGINYVGQGTNDYNAMLVPVSAFSFSGTFKKLSVSLHLWTSSSSNHTFRWAVTNSRSNEALYKSYGKVTDANQLSAGTFTPPYSSSYQDYTIDITDCNVTSGTPLYFYFWRDNTTYGNIHVNNSVTVTLQYIT